MYIYKLKRFSMNKRFPVDSISEKLESSRYYDFEVSSRILSDDINISNDLGDLTLYLPKDNDFAQYDILGFVRKIVPFAPSSVQQERDMYVQKIKASLTKEQYIKLIKFIIDNEGYVVIYDPEI